MTSAIDRRTALAAVLASAASAILPVRVNAAQAVTVFAAATLKDALDAVLAAAQKATGVPAQGVYGPSPSLVKQIENGAPADIFFSADTDWMNEAAAQKLVEPASRVDLLSSKLVLIAPAASAKPVVIGSGFPLASMLGDGRLAMCDPMMMPAGRYGRAALQKLGLWDGVKDRVANASDIRAALAYVSRREAPLGIVFDTDAKLDPGVAVIGTFPADSHPPILYPIAAVTGKRTADTNRVLAFLTSPAAKLVFEKYGYIFLPKGA